MMECMSFSSNVTLLVMLLFLVVLSYDLSRQVTNIKAIDYIQSGSNMLLG